MKDWMGLLGAGLFLAGLLSGMYLWVTPPWVSAQGEPPTMALPERLAPPTMPASPTQADHGAQVYYMTCMACHGDQGQGLTEEWRAVWGPEEQNCWQSKCHAANHPPEGFKLPLYVPPVVGPQVLARFQTAADVQEFICQKMPWQAPGTLNEPACWQLTAYLLRENGHTFQMPLGLGNAPQLNLHSPMAIPASPQQTDGRHGAALAGAGSGLLILLGVRQWRRRRARRDNELDTANS